MSTLRSAIVVGCALVCGVAPVREARAEWPLVWDFDGRPDEPMAARLGSGGDLWVLTESYLEGVGTPLSVLLRIDVDGGIAWATDDPGLPNPTALALRPDGGALAIGWVGTSLRATAFSAGGALEWSRSRAGVTPDFPFTGPSASPIWDAEAPAWRIPVGIAGDLGVISYAANGDPLADRIWSPPAGNGWATSLLPRTGGGLLVAGTVDDVSPPGWWVVALDADGQEIWSRFESGEAPAGAFSGAFLLSADPVRVWADDETACGLFSLFVWALDAANGAPLWDATWPPPGGCGSFEPNAVTLAGDRIVAAGLGDVASVPASFDAIAVSLDAGGGALAWARGLVGPTNGIRADVALIVAPCAPIAVEAEWLVLRDGTRLETRGVARVEGRRVLFTDAGGTLAALPAVEVDLAATEAANRPVAAQPAESATPASSTSPAAAAAAPSQRKPVRRFTDADFDHLDDVDSPTIAFYTTSWCGWCRRSRELLDQLGVRYQEMDVDENAAADAEKDRIAPGSGVPVIAFRETVLTGYSERGIRRMADAWRAAEKEAETARRDSHRPASAKPAAP